MPKRFTCVLPVKGKLLPSIERGISKMTTTSYAVIAIVASLALFGVVMVTVAE
jgi:hypothetical protein